MAMEKNTEIFLADFLQAGSADTQDGEKPGKHALIILNQPIADIQVLGRLWRHTSYRLCADGGANQLHDLFVNNDVQQIDNYLPDIIHGDLDSLRDDVKGFYSSRNVEITQDPDQYSTDFGKAIKQVLKEQPWQRNFLVLGTIAGRLDQGIGLLSEFYREQHSKEHPGLHLWLFSESSISFILNPGKTVIHTGLDMNIVTPNIGILPIFGPAHITTKGLEWDVEDWHTLMGGQVSTSNHIMQDRIEISTDAEVLFTVERNKDVAG